MEILIKYLEKYNNENNKNINELLLKYPEIIENINLHSNNIIPLLNEINDINLNNDFKKNLKKAFLYIINFFSINDGLKLLLIEKEKQIQYLNNKCSDLQKIKHYQDKVIAKSEDVIKLLKLVDYFENKNINKFDKKFIPTTDL